MVITKARTLRIMGGDGVRHYTNRDKGLVDVRRAIVDGEPNPREDGAMTMA